MDWQTGHRTHTGAVFVVKGAPIRTSSEDARFFVSWIDNLLKQTSPGGEWGRFFTKDREAAQKRYQEARTIFLAGKVFWALGMRILNAKKSKYYDAALSHFEETKSCFERAGISQQWDAVVAEVRQAHHRKTGFMPGFERLVAGRGPSQQPSFLERARNRWLPRG
jgi:hypothetical protein